MKKNLYVIILFFIFLSVFFFKKSSAFAENKTFQVVYTNSVLKECIDTEKFLEYRKIVEKHYLKKNAHEIDEDFTYYMTPVCLPYSLYIKNFDKKATKYYTNFIKKSDLPLSAHLRIKVNRSGIIEQKSNMYCHSYETFDIVNAQDEKCKQTLDIIDNIKMQKFDKTMDFDYLVFDTNFINFNSDKKSPKVISSIPVEFGYAENNDIEENNLKYTKENIIESKNKIKNNVNSKKNNIKEPIKPLENNVFDKKYYDRLFYRQN